jgi:hypothetical protein
MTRVPQPQGARGSLKWIQRAVNSRPDLLDREIVSTLADSGAVEWLSPRAEDDYAEYRDKAFLNRIGYPELSDRLSEFWPRRGPQWDALGKTTRGTVLLVEAKAHVGEICSPGSGAGGEARLMIERALASAASHMVARPKAPWIDTFYQLANRLAHLHFLRVNGVDAWLVLVNFIDDEEMNGPRGVAEWQAAYQVVHHVMGIPMRNPLGKFVLHIYPSIQEFEKPPA